MAFNDMKDALLSSLGQAVDGAKDLAGRAADGAKNVAGTVADKARSGGSIVRLSMDAATARENLKKTYQEIGKLCYDLHKDTPEAAFAQLFEEVRQAEEVIAAKESSIAEQRDNFREGFPEISIEITKEEDAADLADVVEQAEAEAEAAVEQAAGEVKAEAEAAVEAAEQAVENAESQGE